MEPGRSHLTRQGSEPIKEIKYMRTKPKLFHESHTNLPDATRAEFRLLDKKIARRNSIENST